MNELRSTIYELLVKAQEAYGEQDAIRYKVKDAGEGGKKETKVRARTYTQLREDSERFSAALAGLGESTLPSSGLPPTGGLPRITAL